MEKKALIAIIATSTLFIYVLLDLILNEVMWTASVSMTISMQKDEFAGETAMFEFFTAMAFVPPFVGIFAFIFMGCKLNALLYFSICCFSIGVNETLKSLYHQPRPYMEMNDITP